MYFHSYTSPADFEQIPVPALSISLSLCYCAFMFLQAQSCCRGNKIMAIFSIEDFPIVVALLTISDLSVRTEEAGGLHASQSDTITLSNCDFLSFTVHTDEKRQTNHNSDTFKMQETVLLYAHLYCKHKAQSTLCVV